MIALALGPLAAIPAHAVEVEFGTSSVTGAALGADRVRAHDQLATLRGRAAGLDWSLDYGYRRFEYQRADGRDRDNLHRLSLGVRWQGDGALRPALSLRPVIASSSNVFKDFIARGSGDDWMLHGAVQIEADAAARLRWRLGLARDDSFGRLRIYPEATLLIDSGRVGAELGWPVGGAMRRLRPRGSSALSSRRQARAGT